MTLRAALPDDQQLVARARKGDREAFARLVEAYQDAVRRLCLSMLRDEGEAEDAAQEAFFKAYCRLKQFRSDGSFKSWVLGIAANHCKDALRARKNAPLLPGEEHDELAARAAQTNVRAEEERVEQRQLATVALAQVPANYREILWLREVAGFEYNELARLLSCSLDAVKARLRRARADFARAVAAAEE